jgi:TRAP-type C4-dicarboxylate transport system permease small subunit
MRTLVRSVTHALEALTLVGMSVVSVTIVVEVVLRYGFGSSLIFTEELTRYTMVWVAFLGGVVALRDGAHVATGGIGDRFGPTVGRVASLVADGLALLFLLTLTWASLQTLPNQRDQFTTTLHVSIFWFYLAIPIGSVLMVLVIVGRRFGLVEAESSDLLSIEDL